MLTDNDLKSYIISYLADRKITYTRLDKHDRAIEVILKENWQQKEEIERLNNIINNFEKWLEEQIKICQAHDNEFGVNVCNTFKDKLKGLKGDSSNEC